MNGSTNEEEYKKGIQDYRKECQKLLNVLYCSIERKDWIEAKILDKALEKFDIKAEDWFCEEDFR